MVIIMKFLIAVDLQNDFISGSLGTKEAKAIIPNVVNKINNWEGAIIATRDTHNSNYLNTREGKYLPVEHCINYTYGHKLNEDIKNALYNARGKGNDVSVINKNTFGSTVITGLLRLLRTCGEEIDSIEVIGLCTDICVISNVMLIKASFPEVDITVDASCCAGVTPESHKAALQIMKTCQVDVINGGEDL